MERFRSIQQHTTTCIFLFLNFCSFKHYEGYYIRESSSLLRDELHIQPNINTAKWEHIDEIHRYIRLPMFWSSIYHLHWNRITVPFHEIVFRILENPLPTLTEIILVSVKISIHTNFYTYLKNNCSTKNNFGLAEFNGIFWHWLYGSPN